MTSDCVQESYLQKSQHLQEKLLENLGNLKNFMNSYSKNFVAMH